MVVTKEVKIGNKTISIETGKLAKQSNGAVMVRMGDTMILVTAVADSVQKDDIDFFPLSVEYRERAFAAGKIPGGFIKREGKPTEKEILSARLIDRPIRPLFPDEFKTETQIAAFVYSFDLENDADVLGAIGASAALAISDIPFLEPIGEVRIGRVNGELIVNPTFKEIEESDMELVVAGTESSIMMVEGESKNITEAELIDALKFAHEEIRKIVSVINQLQQEIGKPKREVVKNEILQALVDDVYSLCLSDMKEAVSTVLTKEQRADRNAEITQTVLEKLEEKYPESEIVIKNIIHDLEKDLMRKNVLEGNPRLDGRSLTDIRPISVDLAVFPRTHGSSLFTRGETQSLTTLTLGSKNDEQIIDGLNPEYTKRFILHYNFPPFSVGEVGRYSGVGRREIGHGNLAERSLKYIVPNEKDFPYTIRLNSDILESNGSSSMATVCAGSLALMDAGIPIKSAVAGIAMGLIKEGDKYAILSDILGNEDHLGDMDFKVAGTDTGITAFQMDIKIQGISFEIMENALAQAKAGRIHILNIMNEAISQPRESISKYAPTLITIQIKTDKIGPLIGPGGKNIQKIQKEFNVEVFIEDDGKVNIAAPNSENARLAKEYIKKISSDPEVDEIYEGKVVKIADFGAFVEFIPGVQGLLHISQYDHTRIKNLSDVMKEGEILKVKLLKIENGKYSLSRKALIEKNPESESKEN